MQKFWVVVLVILGLCGGVMAQQAEVLDSGFLLNLREEPNVNATVLQVLEPHTPLIILGRSPGDTWYQVGLEDGTIGWVKAEYVNVTNLSAPFIYDANYEVPFEVASLISGIGETTKSIYKRGQLLGNRRNVFSKIGDSITVSSNSLVPIGYGDYTLGEYWYLQPVIEYYSLENAREGNSFVNPSLAATIGWNADTLLDPTYSNPQFCRVDESPLECEYRNTRPSIAFIMVGTNDVGFLGEDLYRSNLSRIVELSIGHGIIPILMTIPPRLDDATVRERVPRFNDIVRDVAEAFNVPLLDYYTALLRLPNYGMSVDGIHPNEATLGYIGAADFSANNVYYGYVIRNLLMLHGLDAVWRLVIAR